MRLRLPRFILPFFFLLIVVCGPLPAAAGNRVLVLHSYHAGLSWTDAITAGIEKTFAEAADDVQLHIEYLDSKRFSDESYLNTYARDYFSYKIRQLDFDLVIAADNNAYNFVRDQRLGLFAGRPVVFCGVNGFRPHQLFGLDDMTGVAESPDLVGTLNMVRKLHPERREIVVVGSTLGPTGLQNHAQFIGTEAAFPDLKFTYLNDFPLDELRVKLSGLGDGQVLYLSTNVREVDGHPLDFTETARRLSQLTDVPIYGSWEFFLGHGIVGGKLISGQVQGREAAELALRILQGTAAVRLPVRTQSGTRYMFDYRQLQRFGIRAEQLPAQSILINRPRSFYAIDKTTFWSGGAVTATLVLFSLVLIWQMDRLRRYGRALEENETRYRSMFEENHAVMLIAAPDSGAIIHANKAACDYYGYTEQALTAMTMPEIVALAGASGEPDMPPRADSGQHQGTLSRHRLADGRLRDVEVFSGPIRLAGQTLLYSIVHDVTDRAELEQQVRQKFKMEGIGVMAGGIAHNFNNSLAVILGSLEMALRKFARPEQVKSYLDTARVATLGARDLVAQIMTYSRQGGREQVCLDLARVLGEAQKLLRSALPTSVELDVRISRDTGALSIVGDAGQIQQTLLNLCNNAVHAMEEQGRVLIELGRVAVADGEIPGQYNCAAGDYVRLRVEDSGRGMDARTLERIFDPFYSTKDVNEGTGMGLATVQGIVDQHGGFIRVNSVVGQGSSFALYFPAADEDSGAVQPSQPEQVPLLLTGSERILLVDDDPEVARLGREVLEHLGYQVVSVSDPIAALDLFAEDAHGFDLLLTDYTMPGLSGLELARRARQMIPDLPVILISGNSSRLAAQTLADENIAACCQKPLQLSELSQVVRQVVGTGCPALSVENR